MNVTAIHSHEHTTMISKQLHAFTECYINKTIILYTIQRQNT